MNEQLPNTPLAQQDDPVVVHRSAVTVELGQWYWLLADSKAEAAEEQGLDADVPQIGGPTSAQSPNGKQKAWLGCVTKIGSNFVEISSPSSRSFGRRARIHINDFWSHLLFEPNDDGVIRGYIEAAQGMASKLMVSLQELTARLGVGPQTRLQGSGQSPQESRALAVMSGSDRVEDYKAALHAAKDEQIPKLMEGIKAANEEMVRWMSAGALAMTAQAGDMTSVIDEIRSRIFTVELYAGLTESIVLCRDGQPAPAEEKLRVMQMRCYMDEECLMGYRTGGMEFKDIHAFDEWLAEPDNLARVLPFERCVVAMRVRRTTKDRDFDGSLQSALVNMRLEHADRYTYLYVRNGQRLYRVTTEIEFDELIFPSRDEFDPCEEMLFKVDGYRFDEMITRREYEDRRAEIAARKVMAKQWEKENALLPKSERKDSFFNPHRNHSDSDYADGRWHPFDPSSIYFDDASASLAKRMQKFNRVAVILQGLFDRSECLHPHPPVQTWTPQGFAKAIELIYDGSDVLTNGEPPDIEAYIRSINASIDANSVVIGQEKLWIKRETEKENERISNDWRIRQKFFHKNWTPHGDEGPGYIAEMAEWKPRARKAVFRWVRERRGARAYYEANGKPIECAIEVAADQLFNVSAYNPGDFKQFFADRRTRKAYLKWAPAMLTAEEFHAGNISARKPGEAKDPVKVSGGRKR